MDKEFILEQIKLFAAKDSGRAPGKTTFARATGIKETDWYGKHWARWSDAVAEAGLAPNVLQPALDRDYVVQKFIALIRELAKFPVRGEIMMKARTDKLFPAPNTVTKYLGKPADRLAFVKTYCEEIGGFDDVVKLCLPHIKSITTTQNEVEQDILATGYVYLLKSGKYYKIGSTRNPDRRQYEVGLQLPEQIHHIHSIETDDPSGIEAYWHHRFKAKRLRGEWFDLSPDDVRAFRRRKFM